MVELSGQLSNPNVRDAVAKIALVEPESEVGVRFVAGTDTSSSSSTAAADSRWWRLTDRLGDQALAELLRDRRHGATQRQLAERFGISLSSVKRVLRGGRP